MKKLYIKAENGIIPIEQGQIEKYNLKEGNISPCNLYHITDKYGNENVEQPKEQDPSKHSLDEIMADGLIHTTSEMQDLARGADSEDEGADIFLP